MGGDGEFVYWCVGVLGRNGRLGVVCVEMDD